MTRTGETVKNFFNLYWIRPEVAIWRTLDSLQMKNVRFTKPLLDIGCGDGTFSFSNFGGKTDMNFDVYNTIKRTTGFYRGMDIHDQITSYTPKILKKARIKIDVGIDWKQNLLDKAKKLHLYDRLIQHDLNKPLPFDDQSFSTIFSNVFYWIGNLDQLLSESHRILKSNGNLVICVPDYKFKQNLIFNKFINGGHSWAKLLDRGIYNSITKHCYSLAKWKSLFFKKNFNIQYHSTYLSEDFIKFWTIGMRPYSPYIIDMTNNLQPRVRKNIKSRLIKEISPIIESYVNYEMVKKHNGCFHLFVLKKKS